MTTTPCGRMEPTPGPTAAFDLNQALLQSREQARAQWAEGLAQFQMAAIADTSMQEVVQAAAPAFALGFSFSAQKLINEEHEVLRVTLRHRGGAEEFSEAQAPQEGSATWHALTASLLAGLLGIPVSKSPRTIEPKQSQLLEPSATGATLTATGAAAPAADDPEAADDEWDTGVPDGPEAGDSGLEPLSDEEIATLHKFLGAMPQEARKRFTIEFRHHFQVPREVRTIKDRITQRRHKDFIDVFERELAEKKG
ncbi:hypothetical protein [Synechococcus sp. BA-132 BA5]|uniref:hypothetical protein n=1 Tax=Synechococcus sp. BA-132 BA5 TaxID=3110252 RepID=UPI002B20C9F1|nr:hypothetical protein [Synechococcus sp. BA-132 BA5]MEA5414678.1 hypothetical protein [Synechococcus sp. BA-132 BA5]